MSSKALSALKFVKETFLNDPRWDDTDIGKAVTEAIAEEEKETYTLQERGEDATKP